MQSTLTDQQQTLANWGIVKNLHQYNSACQVIYLDNAVGEGYFENYDFEQIGLARLNCQFHHQHRLANANSRHAYWIYIILQGKYQMYSAQQDEQHDLLAPAILLLKGDLGEMVASIPADVLINAFYIEFDKDYFAKLQQQLQNNPNYQHSILRHFFYQQQAYCFIPLTKEVTVKQVEATTEEIPTTDTNTNRNTTQHISNPIATDIIERSWQLYRTPMPTDEISLMTLQGATYSFVSELLMQSFSKLYQFNVNYQPELLNNTNSNTHANAQTDSQTTVNPNIKTSTNPHHSLYAVQAKLLLDQFYYENWTIRQLAKRVHTNECYLKKDFKTLTGMTIGDYRKHKRMQQAVILLKQGVTTPDIANQLGFNSHDYFLKTFVKFYQCQPKDYQQMQNNQEQPQQSSF